MGRTISLKLTDKEERIVSELNRRGISNSELLRDALWYYFGSSTPFIGQKPEQTPVQIHSSNRLDEDKFIMDYIAHLKEEIQQLREQNQRFQEQIGQEFSRLHGQLYRISRMNESSRLNLSTSGITKTYEQINSIVNESTHSEIDEFLKKRSDNTTSKLQV
ncbi:MAG: hypothetical protein QXS02_04920 [Candidatus Thermoplasmatota archaeon]